MGDDMKLRELTRTAVDVCLDPCSDVAYRAALDHDRWVDYPLDEPCSG